MRRPAATALAAAGLALLAAAPAQAAQTTTQRFFSSRLQADGKTSKEIRELLAANRAFVDKAPKFRDLTGDGKADAVVRVQSGGAAGAIALYVFSTDTGKRGSELKVVFRSEELERAETRVRDDVLRYRSARPDPGDEVCCPTRLVETRLRWRDARHRFEAAERREVSPGAPWGDQEPAPGA
jgi:hypothetical protein